MLEHAIVYFNGQEILHDEISQISQFIHIGHSQFRMMKGFQEMKKTHQAAVRLKRLDIVSILEAINSYVSDDFESEILVPHRQNLDYLLIKLQGFSKVLIRIIICSRKSSRYFLGLIKNGSFYIKGSIFVSTLAKVWDSSRQLCLYSVNLYNNLVGFREKLEPLENLEWISKNYIFPEKLDEWLDEEYQFYVNNETFDSKLLVKQDDVENFRNNIMQIAEILKKFKTQETSADFEGADGCEIKNNEQNEKLPRKDLEIKDFTPISRKHIQKTEEEEYNHTLASIATRGHIKLFIKFEDRYRKQDVQKSITIKKIQQKLWKEIKSDMKNKLQLMQESSLVEYFKDNLNYYLNGE